MTILTKEEIVSLGLVKDGTPAGWLDSSYDSTVGAIITQGGLIKEDTFVLKPRSIVWVQSQERFALPDTVTGITTLRTTWTKRGILTLTVGVVDPSYDGYLSTAAINFSKNNFVIQRGEPFFRTVFFKHEKTNANLKPIEAETYRQGVVSDSSAFSESFLTIDTLATELTPKILSVPRVAVGIGAFGLALALVGILLPIVWGIGQGILDGDARLSHLEERVRMLENGHE